MLVDPLRHRVVVHLLDLDAVHDVLGHHAVVVAVDLGRREVHAPEAFALLHAQDVLGADGVGAPDVLVVVLAVPAPELGREVVDEVEAPRLRRVARLPPAAGPQPLDLTELADVAARVLGS